MLLARHLFRRYALGLSKKYPFFKALDHVIAQDGFKFTLLMRLCPLIPYNAYNYILGVTSVKFVDFALGGVGMIPGALVYVFIGTTLGSIGKAVNGNFDKGPVFLVLLIVGSISAFAAMTLLTIKIKRYLKANIASVHPLDSAVHSIE